MILPNVVIDAFDQQIRQSGIEYYVLGKIVQYRYFGTKIAALVKGHELYNVTIALQGNSLGVSCECPHFYDDIFCKHIWAVIWRSYKEETFSKEIWQKFRYVDEYIDGDFENIDEFFEDNSFDEEKKYDNIISFEKKKQKVASASWKTLFSHAQTPVNHVSSKKQEKLFYYLNLFSSTQNGLPIEVMSRYRKVDGKWSVPQSVSIGPYDRYKYEDKMDLAIISILFGNTSSFNSYTGYQYLSEAQVAVLLPMMTETERLYRRNSDGSESGPLQYDKTVYFLRAVMSKQDQDNYQLTCKLFREDEPIEIKSGSYLWGGGLVVLADKVAKLDCGGSGQSLFYLARQGNITIPNEHLSDFLKDYYNSQVRIPIDFPDDINLREEKGTPVPCMRLLQKDSRERFNHLIAEVFFDYAGTKIQLQDNLQAVYDQAEGKALLIDQECHRKALAFLNESGVTFVNSYYREMPLAKISKKQLTPIVNMLLQKGWRVEGEKGAFKRPGKVSISVITGVDWFDVHAKCSYENTEIPLPRLLDALKRGEQYITLGDGSIGLLPDEWLHKYASFAKMGKTEDGAIRFRRTQALLIDAMLAEQQDSFSCDEKFNKIREEMNDFKGIKPLEPPKSFKGTLRPYQKDSLGWFSFLERFGFGGCLADDMGLGKTVQVLSQLDSRRALRSKKNSRLKNLPGISLVVAPRSLIFNWMQEAQKFTPLLKILDYSENTRLIDTPDFKDFDLVLVTYGTLRRDIVQLKEIAFDYVILDEAQVIKNAKTITAKSTLLLNCQNRLALSGTPVENHLGDLWSIFEFLNPGILGTASGFAAAQGSSVQLDDQNIALLRSVLKPFILRRKKSQVASDLPARTEEVIICEMEPAQAKVYDELKRYYRNNLLNKIAKDGINRSKIQILEALLRLRQAACHPGLIDASKSGETSVKLETLISQIEEIREEGHKCLVFSQFTTMLSIVKNRLDKSGIFYEYLDGNTKDRQSRVERFQNDETCQVFLISLKAGGVGLNLTAAEYVFILDPWWNPAAEAQAIDRTHRIGQGKPVFAYKMICKGTVEEKVLELQNSKRQLADSIISSDESIIRSINTDDLKLLLG